jgi:hypothetical protein
MPRYTGPCGAPFSGSIRAIENDSQMRKLTLLAKTDFSPHD